MIRRVILVIVFLFLNLFVFSQEAQQKLILTSKQNFEWVDNYKLLITNAERLDFIKKKVFYDRIYNCIKKSCICFFDASSLSYRGKTQFYECKIAFILKVKEEYYKLDIDENYNTYKILKEVKSKYINSIEVVGSEEDKSLGAAYFGVANCGVGMIIKSDSKKLHRKIKRLLK